MYLSEEMMDLGGERKGWTNGADLGTEIITCSFNLNIHRDALGFSPSSDADKLPPLMLLPGSCGQQRTSSQLWRDQGPSSPGRAPSPPALGNQPAGPAVPG